MNSNVADVNECTSGSHNCHQNATCTNTLGSFSCLCKTGHQGNGVTCVGKLSNTSAMNIVCINLYYTWVDSVLVVKVRNNPFYDKMLILLEKVILNSHNNFNFILFRHK